MSNVNEQVFGYGEPKNLCFSPYETPDEVPMSGRNSAKNTYPPPSADNEPPPPLLIAESVFLPGEGEGGPRRPCLPESPTRRMFMALTSRYQVINFVKKFIVFLIMKYFL